MLTLPAALFGVALVEIHDFTGKKGGFVASGTRTDFEKSVAVFGFVAGKEGVLDFLRQDLKTFSKGWELFVGQGGEFLVVAFGEFFVPLDVVDNLLVFVPECEEFFEAPMLAHELGGICLVVEKPGLLHELFNLGEACRAFFDEGSVVHGRGEDLGFWQRGQG